MVRYEPEFITKFLSPIPKKAKASLIGDVSLNVRYVSYLFSLLKMSILAKSMQI